MRSLVVIVFSTSAYCLLIYVSYYQLNWMWKKVDANKSYNIKYWCLVKVSLFRYHFCCFYWWCILLLLNLPPLHTVFLYLFAFIYSSDCRKKFIQLRLDDIFFYYTLFLWVIFCLSIWFPYLVEKGDENSDGHGIESDFLLFLGWEDYLSVSCIYLLPLIWFCSLGWYLVQWCSYLDHTSDMIQRRYKVCSSC